MILWEEMSNKCNELGSSVKGDIGHLCAGVWKRRGSQTSGKVGGRDPAPQRTALLHNTFSDYVRVFLYRVSTGRFSAAQLLSLLIYFFCQFSLRHASLIND